MGPITFFRTVNMPQSLCSATWKCSRTSNQSTDISALPQIFVTAHPISDIEALPLLELKLELPVRCRLTHHQPHLNSDHHNCYRILRVQTSNHIVDSIRASPPLEFSRARLKLIFAFSTPPRVSSCSLSTVVYRCGTDVVHARCICTTMGARGGYWDGG
jgi:hypothetical protein